MTPFVDAALAARIEASEAGMMAALAAAVQARGGSAEHAPAFGGIAVLAAPGSPLNKVLGAGLSEGAADDRALDALEARAAARGVPVRFELASRADPAFGAWLTGRGYTLLGCEDVLVRPVEAPLSVDAPVATETVGPATLDAWLAAAVAGFGAPDGTGADADPAPPDDAFAEMLRDFLGAEGMVHWLARRGGEVAGSASAFVAGDFAFMAGASTLPAHRRRGVQRALIAARLAFARARGCRYAVVTTSPGSQSQANALGAGYALAYTRMVLSR